MKNKFTLNESERERILNLHEQQKPGLINRIKGAVQGFKQPGTVTPPVATPTVASQPVASPPVASPPVTTPPPTSTATSAATSAATSSWATSADNTTVCQTKPSQTKSPQVQQIQAALNKLFTPKPESKTIKDCKGGVLFPLKEDGMFGANTAKAILIAMNYKKLGGGTPQGQPTQQPTQQPIVASNNSGGISAEDIPFDNAPK